MACPCLCSSSVSADCPIFCGTRTVTISNILHKRGRLNLLPNILLHCRIGQSNLSYNAIKRGPWKRELTMHGKLRQSSRHAYVSPPPSDIATQRFPSEDNSESSIYPVAGGNPEPAITWRVVSHLLWKERWSLLVALAALIGCTSCTLTMPIYSGRFFEALIGKRSESLWKLVGNLGIIYSMEPVFTVVFVTNMINTWEKVMSSLRSQLFHRLIVQKVEFFDRHKVGELTSLLSSDLGSMKDIINENVSRDRGFRALSETVGTLVILFFLSPQLAPVLGILMLSISASVAIYKRTTVPVFKAYAQAQSRLSETASETFSTIRTVKSFGGERKQITMFLKQVIAYQTSGKKLGLLKSLNESWTRVVVYVSLMAVYILGGTKVKAGELAVGKMVSFIGYTFTLTFAVQGVVNTLADVRGMLAALENINSIVGESEGHELVSFDLDRDVIQESMPHVPLHKNTSVPAMHLKSETSCACDLAWSGDVILEDVYFAYPLRPDVDVLRGVCLTLKRNTITAVVGSSGAGKSTIVQLLAQFYEPTKGRITIGGRDIREFDKMEWTRAVSIVNQEPVLFAVSVAENIAYGLPNEDVSHDKIVEAAIAANAHDFILSLPQGYETLAGERGSLLSGGQRQRIAIARALLKNSPILILDEATSALDSVSERLVQDALNRLMKGRTTLVIAHRLSTVQASDQIAVVAQGQVVELGAHTELLAKSGVYASLVNTQRLAFE